MGKDIQIFNNDEFGQLRTAVIDGEPWFVGKDVAVATRLSTSSGRAAMNNQNNGVWDDENNCMMFDLAKTQPNDRRDNL